MMEEYTAEEMRKFLQGRWIQLHTEHEHYMVFEQNTFHSKHREGTFMVEPNEHGELVLDLSSARHSRILHVIDHNTITMSYQVHGNAVKNVYRRDNSLLTRLFRR